MARQDRYRLNNSPGREDNLSGTDVSAGNPEPVQYNIGTLNDFYQRTLTQDFLRNKFLLGGENGLFEGFVTNNVTTNITGSTIPLTDPLFRADLTGEVTIQLGSSIFSFLNQAGVEVGARLTIINHIANRRFSSDIERIDGANGRIILEDSVPADRRLLFDENSDGANTITVIRNDGISIEGPLNVNGIITGNFTTTSTGSNLSLAGFLSDFALIESNGQLIESYIENDIDTAAANNGYTGGATIVDTSISIYMTDDRTLRIGNNITGIYNSTAVIPGSRVLIRNEVSMERAVGIIDTINAVTGTITFTNRIANFGRFSNTSVALSSNDILVVRSIGVNITGDLTVSGTSTATNVTNQANAGGVLGFWCGAEAEYQTLVMNNEVSNSVAYLRIP